MTVIRKEKDKVSGNSKTDSNTFEPPGDDFTKPLR